MSLTTIINYDTAGNFSFDPVKAEFVGPLVQLKLLDASQNFSEPFTSSTGFTFDSGKTEFSAGLMQQKSQAPNAILAATYASNANAIWHVGGGSLVATSVGTPTFVAGKMVCTGTQGVYYTANTSPIETRKFLYTPNYTGAPPTNINVMLNYNGTNNNDRAGITHSPSGNTLRLAVYDSTGVVKYSIVAFGPAWNPTAGVTYEFELVINSSTGNNRIFINGTLHGTLSSAGTWTRGTSASRYYVGASPVVYNRSEASFDDFMLFNNAQHTASYTSGYTVPSNLYVEDIVTIPQQSHVGVGSIISLDGMTATATGSYKYAISIDSAAYQTWNGAAWVGWDNTYANASTLSQMNTNLPTLSANGAIDVDVKIISQDNNTQYTIDILELPHTGNSGYDTAGVGVTVSSGILMDGLDDIVAVLSEPTDAFVQLILKINGTDYYYSGGWVVSDGSYAQSNTIADILTNKATLPVSSGATVRIVAMLKSDTGQETPTLTSLEVDYDFYFECDPTLKCIVYGCVVDNSGNPVVGATISVDGDDFYYDGTLVAVESTTTTNAMGAWDIQLIETNTTGNTVDFTIEYDNNGETVTRIEKGVEIPNQATAKLSDIL